MGAYYNENDPFCAAWLRNLIDAGHIAPGEVDERDIRDVVPADLAGFDQHHFFAGIGVWSYALRLTGWPNDRPVWTGSCPCQPFSAAGLGAGIADERHLWPAWFHLIDFCRPPVVFGEQVTSKAGLGWFDIVSADLEGAGYACGANDICSAGIGSPNIRARLWFVAEGLGHAHERDTYKHALLWEGSKNSTEAGGRGKAGRMADAERDGQHRSGQAGPGGRAEPANGGIGDHRPGPADSFWRDADWLFCQDGKWRPVEPGSFPLAHGATARVGKLRAYGNAINPWVAAEFIAAFMEVSTAATLRGQN